VFVEFLGQYICDLPDEADGPIAYDYGAVAAAVVRPLGGFIEAEAFRVKHRI